MRRSSIVLAVVSGKGGVGKSVVSVNLAETLARDGFRVALLDADAAQGACRILLNEPPGASIADASTELVSIEDALQRTTSGIMLAEVADDHIELPLKLERLYPVLDEALERLARHNEYVIIDTPAGSGELVRWALDRADMGALVLAEEPTAIADAYRLIKFVWQHDAEMPMGAIVNFADSEHEARSVADRFATITQRFTGNTALFLGWVPFSAEVRSSVRDQSPAVRQIGPVRTAFEHLAAVLTAGESATDRPEGASRVIFN
ncbi:MAG: P-loop NTPase [Bacteroidota bacterium]